MDTWPFDLFGRFNQLTCSDFSKEKSTPLQISINHGGETKYKFVRSECNTLKFYNGEVCISEFANPEVLIEWLNQFFNFNAGYQIIWHHQGEEGVSTPHSDECLLKLLKILLSEEVI